MLRLHAALLVLPLLVLLLPAASADVGYCDGTGSGCLSTFHSHLGNCSPSSAYSYNYNGAQAVALAQVGTSPLAVMHVYAYDACSAYSAPGYSSHGQSINAAAYGTTPAGYVSAGVSWWSWGGSYGSGCDMAGGAYTAQTGSVSRDTGTCPLGAPPTQPFTVLP